MTDKCTFLKRVVKGLKTEKNHFNKHLGAISLYFGFLRIFYVVNLL